MMGIRLKAYTYLTISLFTGALLPVVLVFSKGMDIYEFFMLTYLATIPLALLLVYFTRKSGKVVEYLKNWKKLAVIVLVGFLSYIPIEYIVSYSEHFVTASLTAVVFRTYPLLMLVFLPAMLKERLSKWQIAALLLAFAGLYIALTAGNIASSPFGNVDLPIVLLLAFGALAYAFGSVVSKKYAFDVGAGVLLFNVALFALFAGLFAIGGHASAISLADVLAILYVSIANNIVGFYMFFSSLRTLKTTVVTNTYFLSPFITVLFASLILGEAVKVYYIVVAALVAVGLVIQKFDTYGGSYAQKKHKAGSLTIFDVTSAFVNERGNAFADVVENGGKVLAVKLHNRHYPVVKAINDAGEYGMIYTNRDEAFRKESGDFVKDVLGIGEDEMAVMKAGKPEACEDFFAHLQDQIHVEEGALPNNK